MKLPWGLNSENVPAAWFHTLIQKVRVMLKFYRVAELCGN
jgi:hypothetical protein